MPNINNDDLRRLDLNLLLPFVVVVEEGGVTRAAERLYLTQPAVNAALQRLRDAVGEELFVRQGRGLRPTPRAQALFESARDALAHVHRAIYAATPFDAALANQVFVIGLSDDVEILLAPVIAARLAQLAPQARFLVRPINFRSAREVLDERDLDLAISVFDELPSHIARQRLFESSFVGLYASGQISLPQPFALPDYLGLNHVIVSYNGDFRGIVEDQLADRQLRRNVRMALPGFASVPYVVQSAPLMATLPAPLAYTFARTFGLQTVELPLDIRSHPVEMVWHRRKDADAAHAWLRERVAEIVVEVINKT